MYAARKTPAEGAESKRERNPAPDGRFAMLINTMVAYAKYLWEHHSMDVAMFYGESVMRYLGRCLHTCGSYPDKLHRQNVLDFKTYLLYVACYEPKVVNSFVNALSNYNGYLIYTGRQTEAVVRGDDIIPVGSERKGIHVSEAEVESFRRRVLETRGSRDYAIVTIMAYAGFRRAEVANLKECDISFDTMEIIRKTAGVEYKIAMNDKITKALLGCPPMNTQSGYLFPGRGGKGISESRISRIFDGFPGMTSAGLHRFFRMTATETVP
jgi:integrase